MGTAQEWQMETPHLYNPQSDDTDAGGTRFWHNKNKNNWLAYNWVDKKGEKIQIILMDYERPNRIDTVTTLLLHLANRARSIWIADKITIQKYGERDGKPWPPYSGHITEEQFGRITQKVIDRLDIWRKYK